MAKDLFLDRHIGPRQSDVASMLQAVGVNSLEELISETLPESILLDKELDLPKAISEFQLLEKLKELAGKNKVFKNYIGQGYYDTITPSPIIRHVLEDASWYTSYTPYQAEISQGRLEALLNFQTVVTELTKMEISNCSLLDEATAAWEAIYMMHNLRKPAKKKAKANKIFVDQNTFAQTREVILTRSEPLGIEVVVDDYQTVNLDESFFGAVLQYPAANGSVKDYSEFVAAAHNLDILCTAVADLMSLVLLVPPGDWGVDITVGSTQRFGIPMGFGGPHAAFLACREAYVRHVPGRIIGVTKNKEGKAALRMALQTREQHIKRERATSNICTAQALLATMAGFYAVYHGKTGLQRIAKHIHTHTVVIARELKALGYEVKTTNFFDTIQVATPDASITRQIKDLCEERMINIGFIDETLVSLSVGEQTSLHDLNLLLAAFAQAAHKEWTPLTTVEEELLLPAPFLRTDDFLTSKVFNAYHSETAFMRYIKMLERKDLGLNTAMIPLGSCTMKLNAASQLFTLSWVEFGGIHPFAPHNQTGGYNELIEELETMLSEITGFAATTLQPNSGASGEHTGLLVIRAYHQERGEGHRDVVLIPRSAHGTNPASATVVGYKSVIIKCDEKGNVDLEDLREKAAKYADSLSAFMVTYPSTHGVFESGIREMIQIIHDHGGQVYMDGANMNAQCGLTSPGFVGADVCHLNLHKTFAIPHGGGGPGVGPIAVAKHLEKYLPTHCKKESVGGNSGISAVSAAPYGSASILPITYSYLKLMGGEGLKQATKMAILNANYIASVMESEGMPVLFKGEKNRVAHELIFDCRNLGKDAGITDLDIAKRLMDYGFHAPTLSFPVQGTLMIEPTESEPKEELDRFLEALISIKKEIEEVSSGKYPTEDNVLKNAPHTQEMVIADEWTHSYSRSKAAYPVASLRTNKFWPATARVDDGFGDRNLMCSCVGLENYEEE